MGRAILRDDGISQTTPERGPFSITPQNSMMNDNQSNYIYAILGACGGFVRHLYDLTKAVQGKMKLSDIDWIRLFIGTLVSGVAGFSLTPVVRWWFPLLDAGVLNGVCCGIGFIGAETVLWYWSKFKTVQEKKI